MPPTRRLVRRQPLMQRIKAYLDPMDFLLWVSEWMEDWDQWQKEWATPLGLALNFIMLVARANSGRSRTGRDDVFGEDSSGTGWLRWFAAFITHLLTLLSFVNAVYTFYRKRQYRLFESSVDVMPSTPSVRRVRVDTNPMSSSPLRFLSTMISDNSAQSRAHPDAQRDVWELSVWDPMPLCLRLFCLFSPGHVLVYWFFLPASPQDARPSTTVATTIALVTLLSIQLSLLQGNFSQQSKDTSVIHREVLNEYDVKYVHPRTQHIMRDVGTQFSGPETPKRRSTGPGLGGNNGVETYTPVTVINKGFHTNPNPNYTRHVDPDADTKKDSPPRRDLTRFSETPQREIPRVKETPQRQIPNGPSNPLQPSARLRDFSSPIAPRTVQRQPQFRSSQAPGVSDGGNLGIYSHAQSPLKKSASTQFNANQRFGYVRDGQRRESGRF